EDYYRLTEVGWFRERRVQLIDGEILEWPAPSAARAAAISLVADELGRAFGTAGWVRVLASLNLSPGSVPEPCLAGLPGRPRDYAALEGAATAVLVAEVSDATLGYDRAVKAGLYASAGIGEYWVVNLVERRLEVYRGPVADGAGRFGHRYAGRAVLE